MTGEFGITPIFGAGSFGRGAFDTSEEIQSVYAALEKHGIAHLDTAILYGDSEKLIGQTQGAARFTVDSKTPGAFTPDIKSAAEIEESVRQSVERTGVRQFDVYYVHTPDDSWPLEEQLRGLNAAHEKGYYRRLGLSNFTPDEVQRVFDVATQHGWITPAVYQGNYSAVARRPETELFPLLRRLGMSYYAYSPIAGGFLTKTPEQIQRAGADAGRFAQGGALATLYNDLYNKPSYLKALELWGQAAETAGASRGELAYRWLTFDSPLSKEHGDAIVFGASKLWQVEETAQWLKKGSIGAEANALVDQIWDIIKADAPLDNWNDHVKKNGIAKAPAK